MIRGGAGKYLRVAHQPGGASDPVRRTSSVCCRRFTTAVRTLRSTRGTGRCRKPRIWSRPSATSTSCPGASGASLGQTIVPPERRVSVQLSGVDRRAAADRHRHGRDRRLLVQRRDARIACTGYNINLTLQPRDRPELSRSPTSIAARIPSGAQVPMDIFEGRNNYHGLETSFTKRMSNRWQASGTYTLSGSGMAQPDPWSGVMNPVAVRRCGAARRRLRAGGHRPASPRRLQRHLAGRLRVAVERPLLLRVRAAIRDDLRRRRAEHGRHRRQPELSARASAGGGVDAAQRPCRRADPPRGHATAEAISRFGGRAAIDGILEVFNVFNHANYGSYTTAESNANYGRRRSTRTWRTSRGWCRWDSASRTDQVAAITN